MEVNAKLVAEFPNVPDYESQMGIVLHNRALELSSERERGMACQLLQQAIDHQRAALKCNPRHVRYRQLLRQHYGKLAEALLSLGEHAQAAKAAADLAQEFSAGWQEYHLSANILALCVPATAKDTKLSEEKRKELVQSYGTGAVEMLRRASQKGFTDVDELKRDREFDPLRSREDFQNLLRELEAKAKEQSK
jgi:hypothetical protein